MSSERLTERDEQVLEVVEDEMDAIAGDDDTPCIALLDLRECVVELVDTSRRECIHPLWIVQRNRRDAVFVCCGNILFGHSKPFTMSPPIMIHPEVRH